MKKIVEINQKFGRLTILSQEEKIGYEILYKCICDCGNIKIVNRAKLGKYTNSCGCLRKELTSLRRKKHGDSKKKNTEYKSWCGMKSRCYNINNIKYKNYGGRGIIVCDRWLNSYENFLLDMGNRPSNKHSVDRINNDGNYEPNNCRWAINKEQTNNTSKNIKIRNIITNETYCSVSKASEITKIPYSTIYGIVKFERKSKIDFLELIK